ncbi:MAG: hypothetical protein NZM38_02345 [Cytophagales bacterium]|nr:hypothetical protein [Cytophagales bacterium]MDW8383593.1 hypothetical protein [Flammeovirgaceae bacterium]
MKLPPHFKTMAIAALVLKIIAGWGIGWLYLYYYGGNGDTWQYDWQAKVINQLAKENPQKYWLFMRTIYEPIHLKDVYDRCHCEKPRAMLMTKIVSILYRITNNNYWISSALLSIIAFTGLLYALLQIIRLFPQHSTALTIGFLWIPSTVVWSSGLLKETIMMTCISGIVGISFSWYQNISQSLSKTIFKVLLLLVFSSLLIFLKYYYAATLFPTLLAFFLADYLYKTFQFQFYITFFIAWLCCAAIGTSFHPNLHFQNILEATYKNHQNIIAETVNPNNLLFFYKFQPTIKSFLLNIPLGIMQGLSMPYIWKVQHWFQALASFENMLFLVLAIIHMINFKKTFKVSPKEKLAILAVVTFSLSTLAWLSLAVPNAGSLTRYKIGFLPFWGSLLLCGVIPKISLLLQRYRPF